MFRTRFVGAALMTVTGVLVALVGACAAGGSARDGTAQAARGCAPGVTDDRVTVGVLFPDSGPMAAQYTGFRSGVEARLAQENAAGGVGGRLIGTAWRDDESSPGVNLRAAKDLVADGVFAVLEGTMVSERSAPWLDEQGVPVLGVADQPLWGEHPNMFAAGSVAAGAGTSSALGRFVGSQGGTRAALLVTGSDQASRFFAASARSSLEAAGVPVVFESAVDSLSAERVGSRILAAGADTLIAATPLDVYTGVLITAAELGRPFTVALSPFGYDMSRLPPGLRQALAGTYAGVPFTAFERGLPAHQAYLSAMSRYAPQLAEPRLQSAMNGWISADLFVRGLRTQQGCPSRAGFVRGLGAVTDYDAGGLLARKVDFTAGRGQADLCVDFVRASWTGVGFDVFSPGPTCEATAAM
ncbi:ABC transporter substrate-binding protein [Parafrankia sp. FMc2]|uniref:ABC transporter substrate-binding protein n=1 Tax=Parafrankia sp. FMc2 TaxID=3233196 RepID=UPI0034D3E7DF